MHGTFTATVTWPRQEFATVEPYLMMLAATSTPEGGCRWSWGWSQSARMYLVP
jgi:hypothetical protein